MFKKIVRYGPLLFFLIGLLFSIGVPQKTLAQVPQPETSQIEVDTIVMDSMLEDGKSGYWIDFINKSSLTISEDNPMDWSERGWFVYKQLSQTAKHSQSDVVAYLKNSGISYQSFWIKNTIYVESSNTLTLNKVMNFPQIARIRGVQNFILYEPEKETALMDNHIQSIESNLLQINADDVWGLGITGTGLVVANIDTGVRYSHQALVNQYRGNQGDGTFNHDYNWFDPNGDYATPGDWHGHGTHTMGTMVGDDGGINQIGVAPDAEWVACLGCTASGCSDADLLSCGQFMAAPTTVSGDFPNPDLRPHVVNNSWGDCSSSHNDWYDDVIDAWHAAGIYPVFSNGNASNCDYASPPGLNTVGNPARNGNVTGVGSSGTNNGLYANHSNWGPTDDPDTVNSVAGFETLKPQVIAPGVKIRSSKAGSDTAYQTATGTSMSAPHVSGMITLMWQAGPCLIGEYAVTEKIIEETATQILYDDGSDLTPTNYPNFATGWGEINAQAAVLAAQGYCNLSTLSGIVTDAISGQPIQNAQVVITAETLSTHDRVIYSNASGQYSSHIGGDTYQIEVIKYGYEIDRVNDFVVLDESSNTLNFELVSLPIGVVTGMVTDGGIAGGNVHGYPLAASLTFSADDFKTTVFSDPFDGTYEVELYQNQPYQVIVAAVPNGYMDYTGNFSIVHDPEIQNYQLLVNVNICNAPGYQKISETFSEDFESGVLPLGWENVDYLTNGQVWQLNDPGAHGNLTLGENGFAILDSDYYGTGNSQQAGLRTPVFDFSGYSTVNLQFESHFKQYFSSKATVRVSTDGGFNWFNSWTKSVNSTETVMLDLSANAAGHDAVIVEFLYEGNWDWYWQIDELRIESVNCLSTPGGIVAGYVRDARTSNRIIGAFVTSGDTTAETMSSPYQNGYYWLFQPTTTNPQEVSFKAAYAGYPDVLEIVNVNADTVNRYDFSLEGSETVFLPLLIR